MKRTVAQIKKEIDDCDYKIYFLSFQFTKLKLENSSLEFEEYKNLSDEAKKKWVSYIAKYDQYLKAQKKSKENFEIYTKGKVYVK